MIKTLLFVLAFLALCALAGYAVGLLVRWRRGDPCLFGHTWATYAPPVYVTGLEHHRIASQDGLRICGRCGRRERLVEHCLGLNPPEYVSHWEPE